MEGGLWCSGNVARPEGSARCWVAEGGDDAAWHVHEPQASAGVV